MCILGADLNLSTVERVPRSRAITAWRVFDVRWTIDGRGVLKAAYRETLYRAGTKVYVTRDKPSIDETDYGFHALASRDHLRGKFPSSDVFARVKLWGTVVVGRDVAGRLLGYRATRMTIDAKTISRHAPTSDVTNRRIGALRKAYA